MDVEVHQKICVSSSHMLHLHAPSSSTLPLRIPSGTRENALTVRCVRSDANMEHSSLQRTGRCIKRTSLNPLFAVQQQTPPTNAVSRRNARERKRVRLVNLGFATLRDHVPSSAKNKKLSKVETLRSAIEYIKQLQDLLAEHSEPRLYAEETSILHNLQGVKSADNYGVSKAMVFCEDSSEEKVPTSTMINSGSDIAFSSSPASSLISECSTASPYTTHTPEEFMDIGTWFS